MKFYYLARINIFTYIWLIMYVNITSMDTMGLISCTFHILKLYTIMAAYSTEGEMSQDRIDQGGLYGSLYSENKTWEVARYISVIEAAILMGIVCPLHLPLDRADHFKIVGNAIAVPHA